MKFNPWPYSIVGFLLFVICFNIFFGVLATSNKPIMADENSYEKGLVYQQTIDAVDASKKLGWTVKITPDVAGKKIFITAFRGADKLKIESAKIKLIRPNNSNLDSSLDAVIADSSGMEAQFNFPKPEAGFWLYELNLKSEGKDYFEKGNFVVS